MSKTKSKYTPEETVALVTAWGFSTDSGISTNGITIDELAANFANKWNPRELRAKLSHEGRYKAKPKTKTGKPVIRKDALSTIIGNLCDMAEPDATSLEKSNKGALEKVVNTIQALTEALAFYEAPAEESDKDAENVETKLATRQESEAAAEQEAEEITKAEAVENAEAEINLKVESDVSGEVEPVQTA